MEAQFEIPPIRPSAAVKRTPDVGPFGVIDTMRYVYFILFFWFITIGFERKEKVATYGYSILMIYNVKLGLSLSGLHVLLYNSISVFCATLSVQSGLMVVSLGSSKQFERLL